MKKIIIIIILFFMGIVNVTAATALMQCDYKANMGFGEDSYRYFKYRITYYDDETVKKEIALNNDETLSESNVKYHNYVTMFDKSDKPTGTIAGIGDNFDAKSMKSYYEKKTCPYLEYHFYDPTTTYFNVTDSTATHDPLKSYIAVTKGETKLFDSGGNIQIPVEPKVNQTCAVHTTSNDIDNVPAITAIFSIYDNGKKSVKMYLTSMGESYAQEMFDLSNGTTARLSNNKGRTFIIQISSEEIPKIFEQNFAQINNNNFTCPKAIYLYEESFSEGYYRLTTNKEEAEEWNKNATMSEGDGKSKDVKDGTEKNLKINKISFCEVCHKENDEYVVNGVLKGIQIVGYIIYLLKLVVPLLLIILASVDFAKAVFESSEKPNSEVIKKLGQRILIAAIIFLVPTILNFLLSLVDGASGLFTDSEFVNCTDCLLDPLGNCQAKNITEKCNSTE